MGLSPALCLYFYAQREKKKKEKKEKKKKKRHSLLSTKLKINAPVFKLSTCQIVVGSPIHRRGHQGVFH